MLFLYIIRVYPLFMTCMCTQKCIFDIQRVKGVTASLGVLFISQWQNAFQINSLVRTALLKRVSAHQTKRRRGNHFQFIFLLFFPFTSSSLFSFSAGEVIIAVFPLESCHHSRSNSLSFTHYLHSSIHPSSSFTRNNFTHSSLFSLSICVSLSL